jgi:protein dithiol oxidoreductase (disulfide-forming)
VLAGVAAALVPGTASAELAEGRDWWPVTPVRPGPVADQIEVLEFFSYGCPHCADLNPLIVSWAGGLAADVALRRVPLTFGRTVRTSLARVYVALELMGELGRLDQAVFKAVTQERRNLYSDQAILAWIKDRGVDAAAFAEMLVSFAVATQVAQGDALARDLRIDAVPTIVVDGRYAVLGRETKGFAEVLDIADQLIVLARSQRRPG